MYLSFSLNIEKLHQPEISRLAGNLQTTRQPVSDTWQIEDPERLLAWPSRDQLACDKVTKYLLAVCTILILIFFLVHTM